MEPIYIGIDDTDSIDGMCTTYIGAVLLERLSRYSHVLEARLIRLNPNIEHKTRGNASVCIELVPHDIGNVDEIKAAVLDAVKEYSVFEDQKTNPGVVFFSGSVPEDFKAFYNRALHEVIEINDAEEILKKHRAEFHKFKNGRGIIGALAAIGSGQGDHTYEVIAYREEVMWGKKRNVDRDSVFEMDRRTYPLTFNNVDGKDILITPNSPCPVLFGIRGEDPGTLNDAYSMIEPGEKVKRTVIYRTNQCTDAHLEKVKRIADIRPYSSVILKGTVSRRPKVIAGGHVIFELTDGRDHIACAAFEPTGRFRFIVDKLVEGDTVTVCGGVKAGIKAGKKPISTINLERMDVVELKKLTQERNPLCDGCGRRMESAGRNQKFRCRKCRTHKTKKIKVDIKRDIEERRYQVQPRAMRHLSKPLVRH